MTDTKKKFVCPLAVAECPYMQEALDAMASFCQKAMQAAAERQEELHQENLKAVIADTAKEETLICGHHSNGD